MVIFHSYVNVYQRVHVVGSRLSRRQQGGIWRYKHLSTTLNGLNDVIFVMSSTHSSNEKTDGLVAWLHRSITWSFDIALNVGWTDETTLWTYWNLILFSYIYIYTQIHYSSWLIIGNWRLTFTQPTVNWSYIGLQRRHRSPLLDLAARRSLDVRLHLIWFHGVGSHLTVSFWYIYIHLIINYVCIYIYILYMYLYIRVAGAEQTLPEARNADSWMAARW